MPRNTVEEIPDFDELYAGMTEFIATTSFTEPGDPFAEDPDYPDESGDTDTPKPVTKRFTHLQV